jgi:hypothetical protein
MGWPEHKQMKGSFEWYTPEYIVRSLGAFDLDPCSPEIPPYKIAEKRFIGVDMGLMQNWEGRVFCNPPYGKEAKFWVEKCAAHGNAICLIFCRTDTATFQNIIFPTASSILFFRGRINFLKGGTLIPGTAASASVLIAWGENNARALDVCGLGYNVRLR